jgi:signal transduction histidine kinase
MRLSEFIRANPDDIERAWEDFARDLTPFATDLKDSVLRNDLRGILAAMAEDMDTAQTSEEQQAKSKGHGPWGGALDRISATHANQRLASGFDLEHALAEYRALRSSIVFLWVRSAPKSEEIQLAEVTRFNETIDQAIVEMVRRFAHKNELLNDRFVGALSHEIRNPLNSIGLAAEILKQSPLEEPQRNNVARIHKYVESIGRMIDDLAILVRSRMGVGLPLAKESIDLGVITEEILEGIKASRPQAIFTLEKIGDVSGMWDKPRLQQMIFNLASNAVTHSSDQRVTIAIRAAKADVILTISNQGKPISADQQQLIFEPFVHNGGSASAQPTSGLGLGLFVVRQIVQGHKGFIEVASSDIDGTTFTVRLPRSANNRKR